MEAHEIEQRVRREISGQERLLWTGRPRQGLMLRGADALLIPFSLMWGGFAIFWETSVLSSGGPIFFSLWGIPFVLAGLYLIVGRFFADSYERSKTIYAITSERVIIISGLLRESVKSLNTRNLADISLSERPDGTGTIVLGPASSLTWFASSGWPGSRANVPPMLEGIAGARSVYEMIRQSQKI